MVRLFIYEMKSVVKYLALWRFFYDWQTNLFWWLCQKLISRYAHALSRLKKLA